MQQTRRVSSESLPLLLNGIAWRLGGERAEASRLTGLELEAGTITVLMGPNGAGKTTLIEKLAGLRPPEGLQVTYGSESLWVPGWTGKLQLNEKALRQYSYACQSPEDGLFARSVREELEYSLRPYALSEQEREELRESAIAAVGWDSSWLNRDPYQMSGGERRRSAIASVFVTPAPWLLLDEPTAGLDGAGHETVARELERLKLSGKGIVLVSHDSDWALPMADQVLLLNVDGSATICTREQLLMHPEWLEDTGMSVPEWLRTAHQLWRLGVPLDQVWNPTEAAAAWEVEQNVGLDIELPRHESKLVENQFREECRRAYALDERKAEDEENQSKSIAIKKVERIKHHRLSGFDPRSVWLAYVLVSTGLFLLGDWLALLLGGVIVFALLTAGRVSLRRWRGLIINYAIFSVLTSVVFAWGASGGGIFEWAAFAGTLFTFVRTMLILLLGLAIPLVMSPLSLRRSLEQMVTLRGRVPQWAQRLILTVTLMMRFVPVLLDLWERFVRIFLSRGKSISRNPLEIGRRLRDVSLPFLLALFRMGDEVVLALESRGIGSQGQPSRSVRLKWRIRDYVFVAGALALALGLWEFANR